MLLNAEQKINYWPLGAFVFLIIGKPDFFNIYTRFGSIFLRVGSGLMQKLKPVSFAATPRRQHTAGEGAERTQSTQLIKRSGPPVPSRLVQERNGVMFKCLFSLLNPY